MTQQMSNLHINSMQSQPPSSQQQQQTLGSWPPQPNTTVSQTFVSSRVVFLRDMLDKFWEMG